MSSLSVTCRPRSDPNRRSHPVEGGSCNDHDYVCGNPVNQFDLNGREVNGVCFAGQFTYGIGTVEGAICELEDDLGGKLITCSVGGGFGSSAGVLVGAYTSNAPTVNDVLGNSACVSAGVGFASTQECAFRGRDGNAYYSTFIGVGPRQPVSSAGTVVRTGKVPKLFRGFAKRFIRTVGTPLS